MENEGVSIKSLAVKYGLINGLLAIAFFLVIDFAGLSTNQGISWLGLIITATVVFYAHREFKSSGDGYMNFGQGLGLGTLLSAMSSSISSVFVFIYVKYVNDSYLEILKEAQIAKLEEDGMSDEQIEQSVGFIDLFISPMGMLIMGIVAGVFLGFLVSLVVSAFTKNQKPELL
ncbi:MAG: DUF4199 domain-containing protein [Cyclobacteriaceae bacterium]|nr:DUF4199 domain-containing protein [Cyclobacteriaceae bacterium HetDA_MAG_MS6]